MYGKVFVAGCVRTLKIQEIVVWSVRGRVTARGGPSEARSLHVARYAERVTARGGPGYAPSEARCEFRNVRMGEKAEQS